VQVLIVVVLAAVAGVLVYRVSLRWSVDQHAGGGLPGAGFSGAPPQTAAPSPPRDPAPTASTVHTPTVTTPAAIPPAGLPRDPLTGYLYVPLAPGRRSWQTRVFGLVGLVIVVAVAAAVLAFTLYQGGHLLNKGMKGYFATETPAPTASP
jgi:hypothetical protein